MFLLQRGNRKTFSKTFSWMNLNHNLQEIVPRPFFQGLISQDSNFV